jgi:hypothetical protein
LAILVKFYVLLGEEGNAVVVAELADRNKGAGFEAIENVASFGVGREFGGKGDVARLLGSIVSPFATWTDGPELVVRTLIQCGSAAGLR